MGLFRKSYFERLKDMAEVTRTVLTYTLEYLSNVIEINSKKKLTIKSYKIQIAGF